jgi:hypothetical protein
MCESPKKLTFHLTKCHFTVLREYLRDTLSRVSFDFGIGIHIARVELPCEYAANGAFAGTHETD